MRRGIPRRHYHSEKPLIGRNAQRVGLHLDPDFQTIWSGLDYSGDLWRAASILNAVRAAVDRASAFPEKLRPLMAIRADQRVQHLVAYAATAQLSIPCENDLIAGFRPVPLHLIIVQGNPCCSWHDEPRHGCERPGGARARFGHGPPAGVDRRRRELHRVEGECGVDEVATRIEEASGQNGEQRTAGAETNHATDLAS